MVDEKPQMAASEIEEELLVELQKLPTLHDTQSVTIRPVQRPAGVNVGAGHNRTGSGARAEQVRRRDQRRRSIAATIRPRYRRVALPA